MKIETSDDQDEGALAETILQHVADHLGALEVDAHPSAATQVSIALRWLDTAHSNHEVTIIVTRNSEEVGRNTSACDLCGTVDLQVVITAGVDSLEGVIFDAPANTTVAQLETTHAPAAPTPVEPAPRKLTGLGWGGIGLGSIGVVGLAIGGSLWAKGKTAEPGPSFVTIEVTDYRPAGITLAVVGGAALTAGAIMVSVDAARQRRRRVTLLPLGGPSRVGFSFSGRF
ncbi:MAG: hypothetical protein JKY37_01975 [Nannocystaceae bacterium]|nr:hypothetical protein [Nannocystaceae bacterium]